MTSPHAPAGFLDDPLAAHSAQFPLSRGSITSGPTEEPSPTGIRPWGLLRMSPMPVSSVAGRGDPTAETTGSMDGSEGDPSEDYHND
ncbi:hypothetical protein AB5J62_12225 [Amycolatopsis sp. cg5]|uniref:hypothetical protein n=1 Tax=Amycolatopsis sp. cg5 TaxID=3238802 RepID=UPI0035244B54